MRHDCPFRFRPELARRLCGARACGGPGISDHYYFSFVLYYFFFDHYYFFFDYDHFYVLGPHPIRTPAKDRVSGTTAPLSTSPSTQSLCGACAGPGLAAGPGSLIITIADE